VSYWITRMLGIAGVWFNNMLEHTHFCTNTSTVPKIFSCFLSPAEHLCVGE
jgi:hypothetical protein